MIPLLRRLAAGLKDLLWNEAKARAWARAFLLWASTAAATVVAYPIEVVVTWGLRDWAIRLAIAGVAGLAGLVVAGQRNPTDAEIAAAVERAKGQPPVGPAP